MSWRDFRFSIRPISQLAIGCVAFTTWAAAAAAHWLLGYRGRGIVLGAIVSPPDAVAPLHWRAKWRCRDGCWSSWKVKGWRTMPPRWFFIVRRGRGQRRPFLLACHRKLAEIAVGEILWGLAVGWGILKLRHWVRDPRLEIYFQS